MELESILKTAWSTPAGRGRMGQNIFVVGPPGCGKTQRIGDLAEQMNLHAEFVLLSIREPSDVVGFPFVGPSGVFLEAPAWAKRLVEKKTGVLVADEFNHAPPSVQSAFLRVAQERVVGDLALPSGVRIVCIANPTNVAGGGAHDISAPMANRFIHVEVAAEVEKWVPWMRFDGGDLWEPRREPWSSHYDDARGLVTAFIEKRPELLLKMPDVSNPDASRGWPSPRSWEAFARTLAAGKLVGEDVTEMLVGAIGRGPTMEFLAFQKANDLPDVLELLDGHSSWKHNPQRLDRTEVVLSACATRLAQPTLEKRRERADRMWGLIEGIAKEMPGITVSSARTMIIAKLSGSKAATSCLGKLQPVLEAAGIRAS